MPLLRRQLKQQVSSDMLFCSETDKLRSETANACVRQYLRLCYAFYGKAARCNDVTHIYVCKFDHKSREVITGIRSEDTARGFGSAADHQPA